MLQHWICCYSGPRGKLQACNFFLALASNDCNEVLIPPWQISVEHQMAYLLLPKNEKVIYFIFVIINIMTKRIKILMRNLENQDL